MAVRKINQALALIGAAALFGNVHAEKLDVRDAIKEALSSNPQVLSEMREVDARDREVRQALAGYYPTVDLVAAYGFQEIDPAVSRVPHTGEILNPGPNGRTRNELERGEVQLSMRQLVFDGYKTDYEYKNQQARFKSARHRTKSVAEDVSLQVVRVYLEVLKREAILDIAQEALAFHEDVYNRMKKRHESGAGSKADLDQISGRLALARTNVVTSTTNLVDARSNFQRVVGRFPNENELVMPGTYRKYLPEGVEVAVERAIGNHPLLDSANADVEAVSHSYEQSKSSFYPSFHIEAQRDINNNINGTEGQVDDLQVMLRMRYNLFNGHADTARKQQFAHLVEKAKEIRNNAHRAVEEETRLAWAAHESLNMQMPALEAHVTNSLATREAYTQQFDLGRRTLLDLLNTENEYIDARIAHQLAWHDVLYHEYRIFHAMGDLMYMVGAKL